MDKPLILVVEDNAVIRSLVTSALEAQGYLFHTAETGQASIWKAVTAQPDIIILDLGLPDIDGVSIIKKVREWSSIPIIVVSARSDDKDKIDALDAGADDYLTKPFSVDELLARVRVSLRHVRHDQEKLGEELPVFKNGSLKIDYAAGCVFLNDEEVHLTPNEYKILCLLAKNVGKVITHHFIVKEIWGSYANDISALRVFMTTLRKKIEKDPANPQYIQTHIGVGYRMLHV